MEKAAVLLLGTGLFEISINGDQTNLLMTLDCEVIAVLREVCWLIYKQSEPKRPRKPILPIGRAPVPAGHQGPAAALAVLEARLAGQ